MKKRKTPPLPMLLFRGKSLIDVALAVSKYHSMQDFKPQIIRDLGLSEADIPKSPIGIRREEIEAGLKECNENEDELYGEVPNRISDALLATFWEVAATHTAKSNPEMVNAAIRLSDEKALTFMTNFLLTDVIFLNRQTSFLWWSFKENHPCIDVVTKEACALVNSTKLDANVTKEMIDMAFSSNRYIHMATPIDGFREIVCMKKGNLVYVARGQISSGASVVENSGYSVPAFMVLGTLSVDDLVGRMTRKNMLSNSVESLRIRDDDAVRRLEMSLWGEESPAQLEARYRLSGELTTNIVEFVLKLRILLSMEKTPVTQLTTREGAGVALDGCSTPPGGRGISYSVVSITQEFRKAQAGATNDGRTFDRLGKNLVTRQISGFIRRQHYGAGNRLSKFIYIAPFANRYWMNSGVHVTRIVK